TSTLAAGVVERDVDSTQRRSVRSPDDAGDHVRGRQPEVDAGRGGAQRHWYRRADGGVARRARARDVVVDLGVVAAVGGPVCDDEIAGRVEAVRLVIAVEVGVDLEQRNAGTV